LDAVEQRYQRLGSEELWRDVKFLRP